MRFRTLATLALASLIATPAMAQGGRGTSTPTCVSAGILSQGPLQMGGGGPGRWSYTVRISNNRDTRIHFDVYFHPAPNGPAQMLYQPGQSLNRRESRDFTIGYSNGPMAQADVLNSLFIMCPRHM